MQFRDTAPKQCVAEKKGSAQEIFLLTTQLLEKIFIFDGFKNYTKGRSKIFYSGTC
jgi:hypothetical protein